MAPDTEDGVAETMLWSFAGECGCNDHRHCGSDSCLFCFLLGFLRACVQTARMEKSFCRTGSGKSLETKLRRERCSLPSVHCEGAVILLPFYELLRMVLEVTKAIPTKQTVLRVSELRHRN